MNMNGQEKRIPYLNLFFRKNGQGLSTSLHLNTFLFSTKLFFPSIFHAKHLYTIQVELV